MPLLTKMVKVPPHRAARSPVDWCSFSGDWDSTYLLWSPLFPHLTKAKMNTWTEVHFNFIDVVDALCCFYVVLESSVSRLQWVAPVCSASLWWYLPSFSYSSGPPSRAPSPAAHSAARQVTEAAPDPHIFWLHLTSKYALQKNWFSDDSNEDGSVYTKGIMSLAARRKVTYSLK